MDLILYCIRLNDHIKHSKLLGVAKINTQSVYSISMNTHIVFV